MKDIDKPVVRRKSGHTKERIRTNPDLEVWKLEWKGQSAGSRVKKEFTPSQT